MVQYIHTDPEWPDLYWDDARVAELLIPVRHHQGVLLGKAESIGFQLRREALSETLSQDVLQTSSIENEHLDAAQVRSSVGRRLGLATAALPIDLRVEGIVDVVLDAAQHFEQPLTEDRLFEWHRWLLAGDRRRLAIGAWRSGPMRVVSGNFGSEYVHFEAPLPERIPAEMARFFTWFNGNDLPDAVLTSAIAHFWFVTIHPFDDGNGRIARAIADLALARSEGTSQRFYSMSRQIREERSKYYDVLERSQQGTRDITDWLIWYLGCLDRALSAAEKEIAAALAKQLFWAGLAREPLNDRQREMINRLFDGFTGKLTSSKWAKITKISTDTALRDITNLVERGILVREAAGGRSTSYALASAERLSQPSVQGTDNDQPPTGDSDV